MSSDKHFSISHTCSPMVTIVLLSASMYLPFLDFTYKQNHAVYSFCIRLMSLSIMTIKFIHIVANSKISFILRLKIFLCIYTLHFLLANSCTNLNSLYRSGGNMFDLRSQVPEEGIDNRNFPRSGVMCTVG